MPDVSSGRHLTLRKDPSGGLVHAGKIWTDAQTDERSWVPICGLSPRIDTVFWSMAFEPIHITCLTCLVYDRRLV